MERAVVRVLLRMRRKERKPCEQIEAVAGESERHQSVQCPDRNPPEQTEHAQIEQSDGPEEHRQAEVVQYLERWPYPQLVYQYIV